ncbi:MAG: cyclic nucleotide-binding domain-containing protein [Betaproteobacteria bacterium]|nr:cyclic nucleotide-binding domain-containing protein [Betaproteobacteria bacterium]
MDYVSIFKHGKDDKVRETDDVLLLPEWGESEWRKLLDRTTPQKFRTGEVAIHRGAVDRSLLFVAAGILEVGVLYVDGLSMSPLARITAGTVIGEQSFFDCQPRSANVWAVTDGELLRLAFEEFQKFSREEPALVRDFLFALGRVLSLRLRNTTMRVRR